MLRSSISTCCPAAPLFSMRLSEANGVFLDAFRFDTLDTLFEMTGRVDVLEVAA